MRASRVVLRLVLPLLFPLAAFAGNTGKIAGVVSDSKTKEPLIGANVVVEGASLGASTDIDGKYVILNVPPGRYSVSVSYVGYRRVRIDNVQVSVDFTTTLNIPMDAGEISVEGVEVRAERSPLIRQDLTNPVASITSEAFSSLPVTDISELIGLQAGVTVDDDGTLHIRGGYGNEIAYTLNGINLNNPYGNSRSVGLASNAVQEVSVSSGTFSAEYGTALSGVVNYVTREGGRSLNGGVRYMTGDYWSPGNSVFDNIGDIDPFNTYRFEASLGGPLPLEGLSFFTSGVYTYNRGTLTATRIYNPGDSYLSREGFPTGDLRRGSSSDPYYFGPLNHDTTDLVGGPTGDGTLVPLNWSRSYNLQANLSYRLSDAIKLKYEYVYDNGLSPASGGQSYVFKPDGRAMDKSFGHFHSMEFTHVLNEKTFHTVRASYIIDTASSRAYDDLNDPRYLPSFYSRTVPNTTYLVGGVDLGRFSRMSKAYGIKWDIVAQLFDIHEVKAGAEFRQHDLTVESYTVQFEDPNDPTLEPSFSNVLVKGATFLPKKPTVEGGYLFYHYEPVQASAYVQDKIELFKSIILNLGLRWDYFDPNAEYNPMISEELVGGSLFLVNNLRKAEAKNMVAPRFSVSYPITDAGTIRFSYGHFYQIGSLATLYRNPNYRAPSGTTPSFGNPNVNPQRSVQYELGMQQGLTDEIKFDLTAYYKDVRDYIYSQSILTERGDRSYNLLTNLNYANTRGVSLSFVKRRAPGELLSATFDYTFQIAEMMRTEPTEEMFYSEQSGKTTETYLVPFGFDRSHTITSTVTLGEPTNWNVSMIGYVRTGTPYTPSFPSSISPIQFTQNSDRQPMQWNVDLKAEKYFTFFGMDYSVFLQVDNLFDTKNELSVYASSGRALTNLEQTYNATLFNDIRRRIARGDAGMIPIASINDYYAYEGRLSSPRLVRLGFTVNF